MKKKAFFLLCFGLGIFLLVQVLMPLLSYKLWELTAYRQNTALVSPDPTSANVLGAKVEIQNSFPAFVSYHKREVQPPYSEFSISIPSIKLKNAKTVVDSNNFETHLGHLPGTALPGEKGNIFVTGHSTLLQLSKPNDYRSIFSHLPEVKRGDMIYVEAGGQKFEYVVDGLHVVNPEDVWVINPPDSQGRYLSLMTCVPPGLYIKRLIVFAKLK